MTSIARAIGLAGLMAILFYVRGPLVPFIILAALCGAMVRARPRAAD